MMAGGAPDRVAVGPRQGGLTYDGLLSAAHEVAADLTGREVGTAVLVDTNSAAVPILLFGAAVAGIPFTSLNFRLADPQLQAIMRRTTPSLAVLGDGLAERLGPIDGMTAVSVPDLIAGATAPDEPGERGEPRADADDVAVLLFTSGTTAEPKAALLRHRHLFSYVSESAGVHGRRRGGVHAGQRPELPHRRAVGGAQLGVRGTTAVLPAPVRRGSLGGDGPRRAGHPRHGGADDARADPRRDGRAAASRSPTCGT